MATLPVIGNKGLHASANPLSAVPLGGQVLAANCVVSKRDITESRRGQKHKTSYGFGTSSDRAKAGGFFGESEVVQYGSTLAYDDGSQYVAYSGTFASVDDAQQRMKFIEAAQSLYVNSGAGVFVLDALAGTPVLAGVPKALDISPGNQNDGLTGAPDAGWMPVNKQVAYRAAWGIKDTNGRLKIGAPSGRFIVVNPADAVVAIGNMTRAGSLVSIASTPHGFPASTATFAVTLSPGEANFAAGGKTLAIGVTANTFFYGEAGAAAANTAEQTISAGSRNVLMRVPIPSGITTANFLRLYRSLVSSGAGITPNDELHLAHELAITAANIAAGYIDVTDTAPDDWVQAGAPLHTNAATGDGPLQANERAPLCRDMCEWDDRLWCINTTDKHRFHLTLLGVGSPDGLQANDIIAIGGRTYTAVSSSPGANEFFVDGSSLPSINTRRASKSLIAAINADASSTVYAWYESDGDSDPGKILIEERALGGDPVYLAASRVASWAPALPVLLSVDEAATARLTNVVELTTGAAHGWTVGQSVELVSNSADANFAVGVKTVVEDTSATTFTYAETGANATMTGTYYVHLVTAASTSVNDRRKNGLSFSKRGEPDAFPLTNWEPAGPSNFEALRAIPLADKLFVFDEVGGIHTVSKGTPYSVDKLDGTAVLVAPDTAVVHNNQIYALTTQGACAISDAGVRILSGDRIEEELLELMAAADTAVRRYAFGVSYESDRQYQLWLPSASGDTYCTQAYVFNSLTNTWTRWTGNRSWGAVQPKARLLHLGDADTNKTRVERKSYDETDFADESLAVTISSASGLNIQLASAAGVSVGDMLYQSESIKSLITAVDVDTGEVMVASVEGFTTGAAGAAEVLVAIECECKSNYLAPLGPSVEKNFSQAQVHFRELNARDFVATFDSEKSTVETEEALQKVGFGLEAFGAPPFGTPINLVNLRAGVSAEHARSTHLRAGFRIREARAIWALHGLTLSYEPVSGDRSSR